MVLLGKKEKRDMVSGRLCASETEIKDVSTAKDPFFKLVKVKKVADKKLSQAHSFAAFVFRAKVLSRRNEFCAFGSLFAETGSLCACFYQQSDSQEAFHLLPLAFLLALVKTQESPIIKSGRTNKCWGQRNMQS